MTDFKNMGNNQIMTELKSLEAEHEAIKIRIINDLDRLDEITNDFNEGNKVLVTRIKGQTNE